MAPTILVVGATGNTGKGVVETLPGLAQASTFLKGSRILALTRSKAGASAQHIGRLPGLELIEKNWVEIDAEWLREYKVERVFVASHNEPNQFAEEGQFLVEALRAGVKYVVRISTMAANVHPDFPAYYPRTHWAIENMLSQPEFQAMHWTSLQANIFMQMIFARPMAFIKDLRETGKHGTLSLLPDKDTPIGPVDPHDVGVLAATLLAQENSSRYNQKKLVLNGVEDTTGQKILEMVEREIGEKIKDVKFQDVSWLHEWADAETVQSKNVIRSLTHGPATLWEGKCSVATTSKEVKELAPAKRTPADVFQAMLKQ